MHRETKPLKVVKLRHMTGDVYVTLRQRPNYIETKWSGHITADDVVCVAQAYLELLRSSGCPKLLNDKSDVTGDWQEANDWLQYEWLPRAREAGLRHMAHVYSFETFNTLSAHEFYDRVSPELCIKNFYERQLAEEWLSQFDASAPASQRAATA